MNSSNHSANQTLYDNELLSNKAEELSIVERLTIYITFIVSIVGIIGNTGTLVVLNQRSMRKWRSSMLLSALAAVDCLYLSIIFLSIIDSLTNQRIGLHRSLILCQATVYITHVCSFLSATFTLSFTLQRFVAVLFPLHANAIISKRASIITILLLVVISCSFYSFSFFVTNITAGQCREDETYPVLFPLLIADVCLTFLVPFICILVFNCAIVCKLHSRKQFTKSFIAESAPSLNTRRQAGDTQSERHRADISNMQAVSTECIQLKKDRKLLMSKISSPSTDSSKANHEYSARLNYARLSTATLAYEYSTPSGNVIKSQQTISQRTTKMLVICSTTFLIFNSPYCAVLFYSIISKHVLTRTLDILRHFYFMSFCLNFFLYSLCGNRFRQELIMLLQSASRKCCAKGFRHSCSKLSKFPVESSISRSTLRTGT